MQVRLRAVLYVVALVAGYTALVAWLTWPLAGSALTRMPSVGFALVASQYDLYYSVWALAHESHTLISRPTLFADANI